MQVGALWMVNSGFWQRRSITVLYAGWRVYAYACLLSLTYSRIIIIHNEITITATK